MFWVTLVAFIDFLNFVQGITGLLHFLINALIVTPGRADMYVLLCLLNSNSSCVPPSETRVNSLTKALAIDFALDFLPTTDGPWRQMMFLFKFPFLKLTAKNFRILSLTCLNPVWSSSRSFQQYWCLLSPHSICSREFRCTSWKQWIETYHPFFSSLFRFPIIHEAVNFPNNFLFNVRSVRLSHPSSHSECNSPFSKCLEDDDDFSKTFDISFLTFSSISMIKFAPFVLFLRWSKSVSILRFCLCIWRIFIFSTMGNSS